MFGAVAPMMCAHRVLSEGGCVPLRNWKMLAFVNKFCAIWLEHISDDFGLKIWLNACLYNTMLL